jgi:hypothetical protein
MYLMSHLPMLTPAGSQGGMLSVEEQIIDTTTEEGQAALKELEEQERAAREEAELKAKYADDPE